MARRGTPLPCPACGDPLSPGGRFCRGCGWDADLADSEDAYLDGVDLPQGHGRDDPADFDYERAMEEEGLRPSGAGVLVVGSVIAVLLALAAVVILNAR